MAEGMSAGFDIKQELIKKLNTPIKAAGVRDVSIISGFNVGSLETQAGGIYAGAHHRISDCETTTTSSTSRGVWSAITTGTTLSATTTAKRSGTNCIVLLATAGVATGDGAIFTATTGYELDLTDMNYLGFWAETDDSINNFDDDADITVEMYEGTTKVYSYEIPAYISATPHGSSFGAADTQWYFECPITTSEIESGYDVSKVTSIRIVKTTTAMTDTAKLSIDQLEMYEISAGGYPFKWGIIVPMLDSGSGVTKGDWIELADVVTGTVKKAASDNGVLMVGKAVATAEADATVYVLIYGMTVAIADGSTAWAVGEGLELTTAADALCQDVSTIGIGSWIAKGLETVTGDLDMGMVMVSPNPSGKVE